MIKRKEAHYAYNYINEQKLANINLFPLENIKLYEEEEDKTNFEKDF